MLKKSLLLLSLLSVITSCAHSPTPAPETKRAVANEDNIESETYDTYSDCMYFLKSYRTPQETGDIGPLLWTKVRLYKRINPDVNTREAVRRICTDVEKKLDNGDTHTW